MKKLHTHKVRIYVYDTDYGGVVYHSNYFNYMDEARTEWLRSLGFSLSYFAENDVHFIVRSAEIEYLRPAMLDHLVSIESEVVEVGRTSLRFSQRCYDTDNKSLVYTEAEVRLVCVNSKIKPVAVPADIVSALN